MRRSRHLSRGFTLTELAVVFTIVALLLGGAIYTLSAQTDQRMIADTQKRLEEAKEMLLAYAVVNARLPCPASAPPYTPYSNGTATAVGLENPSGGIACADGYTGFLPGRTLGMQGTDSFGYVMDAWNNPIRYAVSKTGPNRYTTQHTTAAPWSLASTPTDLQICSLNSAGAPCAAASTVTATNIVVAVVWSQGKNFRTLATGGIGVGGGSADELANNKHRLPSVQHDDAAFVYRPPSQSGSTAGEFDDLVAWIPVGVLYNRMLAAGVLP
jgi:prepilin-type N-terminal cleavage/methylation domain-containing protein